VDHDGRRGKRWPGRWTGVAFRWALRIVAGAILVATVGVVTMMSLAAWHRGAW
jgi:hypothetical protein